ncbi:MAG: flagellar hook-basal body protein [Candidatus Brocadiae bacterium]|nr:flagellar hook-basal body protein [Candidatus Brocadiia bacterium]
MSGGLFTSAAGMLADDARVDVLANNIANVRTTGFRRDTVTFRQRLDEAGRRAIPGLVLHGSSWDREPGPANVTGRPLDLAIRGEGFFEVRREGKTAFTRAGDFLLDGRGILTTSDGRGEVLSSAGQPISLLGVERFEINERGEVATPEGVLARLSVVGFDRPERLRKAGDALFEDGGGAGRHAVSGVDIAAGALEGSGVEPVREMVAMIAAFRSYELNSQALRIQDEMLGRAASDVGRLPGSGA